MRKTASPERMRHLEQVMANDSHIADLLDGSYVIERGTVVRRD